MMYLSKGLPVQKAGGGFRVSHVGRIFELGYEMAALWSAARQAPQSVPAEKLHYVLRLEQSGLAVTTKEHGNLANYRLLSSCIICPNQEEHEVQLGQDGRVLIWIGQAGLRLTASELIRLEEQGTEPVPALLGEDGRQNLTERIYDQDTIFDGVLESKMEGSPARDALLASLLRLLHAGSLFLV